MPSRVRTVNGVDPVSWTPQHLGEEVSRCRDHIHRMRRSSDARQAKLRRRDTVAARRKDTRRKILLGAQLIAAAQAGDADAARWLHHLTGELAERDRPLFDPWPWPRGGDDNVAISAKPLFL